MCGWVEHEREGWKSPWKSWNNLACSSLLSTNQIEKHVNGDFRFSAHKLIWLMMSAKEHQLPKAHSALGNSRLSHKGIFMGEHKEIYTVYVKHYMSWMIVCLSCTSELMDSKIYICCERHHKRKRPTMYDKCPVCFKDKLLSSKLISLKIYEGRISTHNHLSLA